MKPQNFFFKCNIIFFNNLIPIKLTLVFFKFFEKWIKIYENNYVLTP